MLKRAKIFTRLPSQKVRSTRYAHIPRFDTHGLHTSLGFTSRAGWPAKEIQSFCLLLKWSKLKKLLKSRSSGSKRYSPQFRLDIFYPGTVTAHAVGASQLCANFWGKPEPQGSPQKPQPWVQQVMFLFFLFSFFSGLRARCGFRKKGAAKTVGLRQAVKRPTKGCNKFRNLPHREPLGSAAKDHSLAA